MSGFGFDQELPAGFQDADFEQRAMEDRAARLAQLRREGKCAHGWTQGYTAEHRPDLAPGKVECLDCGWIASDDEAMAEAQDNFRARYL